jgi:hypothetical protein
LFAFTITITRIAFSLHAFQAAVDDPRRAEAIDAHPEPLGPKRRLIAS